MLKSHFSMSQLHNNQDSLRLYLGALPYVAQRGSCTQFVMKFMEAYPMSI